jgi:hypothetical protein
MATPLISLDVIDIASPCSVAWETMVGDDRTRHCHECKLNVYNLSEMSREEAEALVNAREGRLCVRFFRRADGTILTQDCPVGLRALRRRLGKLVASLAALIGFLTTGLAAARAVPKDAAQDDLAMSPFMRVAQWLDPPEVFAMGAMSMIPVESTKNPTPWPDDSPDLTLLKDIDDGSASQIAND